MQVTTELCPGLPGHVQLVDEEFHGSQAAIVYDPDLEDVATEAMVQELRLAGAEVPDKVVLVTVDRHPTERLRARMVGYQAAIHLAREQGLTEASFETSLVSIEGPTSPRYLFGEVRRGPRRYQVYVTSWSFGWMAFEAEIAEGIKLVARELGRECKRLPEAVAIAREHLTIHLPRTRGTAAKAREGR